MLATALAGCGGQEDVPITQTTLTIDSSGAVRYEIVEPFDRDYYDEEELARLAREEVSDYDLRNGAERVRLEGVEVSDGMLHMVLTFDTASDFSHFTMVSLTYTTLSEARSLTTGADVRLVDDEGVSSTISGLDLDGDRHVIISQEPAQIRAPYRVRYRSDNTELTGRNIVTPLDEESLPVVVVLDK